MASNKMALMMTMAVAMVVFSLATMPSPSTATRFVDTAKLLAALDIPTGKNENSDWCDSCGICTRSLPPICFCTDLTLCSKCVCSITLGPGRRQECETLAHKFTSYCRITETTVERTPASLI